ncbi:uncharacterized protein F5147DRAFT_778647 [Suillus discolor]|uniref:DUF6533 domain-containing protein n=1 Tax=Suillus discolor TaxID=1912936 RepID=A0A9P7JPM7_9AGAM|nr:uncharacterized protein F5147DRAFT_778647 [Suillus discolor]KAG2095423.1 hypothetical protein F5147DRAFT_778647 [Suillus discolor]
MSALPSVSDMTKLQTVKYANLGSLAIFVFDYCITFSEEVRWTWFKPWDVIRIIFIISRYLPFAGVGITAYCDDQCAATLEGYIIDVISIVSAEALLVIRTWAFWQKSKRLLIGLLVYSVLSVAAAIAVDLNPAVLIPGEGPSAAGCYFESTRNSAVVYMILAMFESVMLILTVYKRVRDYKDLQSGIIVTLYHDGMFYMLCILAITLANAIIGAALPIAYSNLFDSLQLVSHSVLASRILFRLRRNNEHVHEPSISVTTLDTANYLRPSSTSMGGIGTTSGGQGI